MQIIHEIVRGHVLTSLHLTFLKCMNSVVLHNRIWGLFRAFLITRILWPARIQNHPFKNIVFAFVVADAEGLPTTIWSFYMAGEIHLTSLDA